ncbi:hypothetical protein M947_03255 [Sulfurimonas hongkongensis]|uniref:PDZ domain-containing protein n=1 Tax=Sulfurimonas hongkongensis TaxID=1172190 RepID=T0JST8_9BACT|nr:S41 family peptidase [Sulfurimonas hongkongensis]EQB40052.1 hypothetical protein M947_03255 [Sulfurimonas hongkongensis]
MRVVFLVFILFASLVASDAKIKYEKVLFNIEKHYFKPFSKDELISKSIDGLLKNTPYLIKSEKQKIKQKLYSLKSEDKKLELLVEYLIKKELSKGEIYEMLISSCMDSLDAHSRYLDKEQMQELRIKTEGIFVGFGISLSKVENSLVVVKVLKNSPASKTGIKVSDIVLKIDGVDCEKISLDKAIELLRKDVGEFVNLSIKRDDIYINFELKRETIKIETLEFERLKNKILYFKISSFDANIAEKISSKIKEYQNSSKAIILDLRGNPGGLVSQAVEVADMFLNRGNIITQIGRVESDKKYFDASKQKTLTELPLAVLVDSNTASSAEILSGALQVHHRATLFGEKTFGKGSVESLYSISKDESLSLTVAHYFLADSSTIEGVGILPDYEVNTQIIDGRDKCLASAEEFLNNKESFTKKHSSQTSGVCTKEEK